MADYFDTSVDFIVGRTEIRRKIEPTNEYELNEKEAELIDGFRNLSAEEKECILLTVRTFLGR